MSRWSINSCSNVKEAWQQLPITTAENMKTEYYISEPAKITKVSEFIRECPLMIHSLAAIVTSTGIEIMKLCINKVI